METGSSGHTVAAENILNNLIVRTYKNGNIENSVQVQSHGTIVVSRLGEFVEIRDTINKITVAGYVAQVSHQGGVVLGPSYISAVFVRLEDAPTVIADDFGKLLS